MPQHASVREVREVRVGKVLVGGSKNPVVLIAGPDVLEDPAEAVAIAKAARDACKKVKIGYIFKASYDKGNRGESRSYRGPMLDHGLEVLARVRSEAGVPVLTDVHSEPEARQAAEVVDIIQVPAYLSMQTSLVITAGETGKPINLKKGQFLSPHQVAGLVRKIEATGNTQVMVTERGTTFGYNDLVCDFRSLPIIRAMGVPVVLDPTHIFRRPGISSADPKGGDPQFVPHLSRAGAAAGIDALFIETHPEPRRAACDQTSMLRLSYLPELLEQVAAIDRLVKAWDLFPRERDTHGFV